MKPEKLEKASTGQVLMVYGRSNTGKTAACRNLPPDKTLWISTEPQQTQATLRYWKWDEWIHSVPDGWEDISDLIKVPITNKTIEYVVIDTISTVVELMLNEYAKSCGLETIADGSFKMYGHVGERVHKLIEKALTVSHEFGVHYILLCHLKYKEKKTADTTHQMRQPAVFGQLGEWLSAHIPTVLRSECFKIGNKIEYSLYSSGSPGDVCGCKAGCLPMTMPNDIVYVLKLLGSAGVPPKSLASATTPPEAHPVLPGATISDQKNIQSKDTTPAGLPVPPPGRNELREEIYKAYAEHRHMDRKEVQFLIKKAYGEAISSMSKEKLYEILDTVLDGTDKTKPEEVL